MRRRDFIRGIAGSAVASPLRVRAQQPKLPTVGFLGSGAPATQGLSSSAFAQRLRELGWIEGRTFAIEYRWTEGRSERYAEIRSRVRSAQGRCHFHDGNPGSHSRKTGDICHPDRLCGGGEPSRQRPGRESGATGRQRHRLVKPERRCRFEATRTLARGHPIAPPIGGPGQYGQFRRCAGTGRDSSGGSRARPHVAPLEIRRADDIAARVRGDRGPCGRTLCLLSTR